ncbi:hypothetical protein HMPREF3144_08765 [Oligella sp. HMSC05A10]|nr:MULTISPECIES: RNase A-like domain-containing protein [unclassified Oligella]OFS83744.1 hypothetical protein HMPREF3144_08765 [Oligella sp. HMSC05A10]OFV50026.1 hypothetical protein HMPREF3179_03145 [Oligella sp. HMSC09E12]
MQTEEGLRIVLSPVQMAGILHNASISEGEILSNRLWGGLNLVSGMLEMLIAGGMCAAPEPTMLTKAGCIVVGAHAADMVHSSFKQILTGTVSNTRIAKAVTDTAETLGASKGTANIIALSVDLAVPMGFASAIGAARVATIRAGRIKLAEHEAVKGSKAGGHTISRHVGHTEKDLLYRLANDPKVGPAASSFTNLRVAERAISEAMRVNRFYIEQWIKSGEKRKLVIQHTVGGYKVGGYIAKGTSNYVQTSKLRVVLDPKSYNGKQYYILTAYPIR